MKTALTNEGKILFFGQNIGQEYEFKPNNEFIQEKISFHFIVEKHIKDFECRLIKTPLSLITDEDAHKLVELEMENWSISEYEKLIIDGTFIYFTPLFVSRNNKQAMINLNRLCFDQHKYLESKGYALKTYCPIAKRIVTVEEQVESGWITLKTN